MAANMDTVGTFQMAEAFASQKLFTCIHKHYPVEMWEEWVASHKDIIDYVAVSSGEITLLINYPLTCSLHIYI